MDEATIERLARAVCKARDQDPDEMLESISGGFKPAWEYEIRAVNAILAALWQPIETADCKGQEAVVYRPLAETTSDEPIAVKRLIGGETGCWNSTVPTGQKPCNPTDGFCHVTHWMPLWSPEQADG